MNILYICHPESDYGGAFLYSGLVHALGGSSHIYDLPVKWSYHGELDTYALPNIPNGTTAPLPWMPAYPEPWSILQPGIDARNDSDIQAEAIRRIDAGFFDLVIVESPRMRARQCYEALRQSISRAGLRVIMHDGEDYSGIKESLVQSISPIFC